MSSPRRRSLAVWMSSSPSFIKKVPAAHSAPTRVKPSTNTSRSEALMIPATASARAYAWLPRTS